MPVTALTTSSVVWRSSSSAGVILWHLWLTSIVSHQLLMRFSSIIVLCAFLAACSPTPKRVLAFRTPSDWEVEVTKVTSDDLTGIYSVTLPSSAGLLLLWHYPKGYPEDISEMNEEFAGQFLKKMKASEKFTVTSEDYEIVEFAGDHCRCRYVIVHLMSEGMNTVQTVLYMDVDGDMWVGQFTGVPSGWANAVDVLKTVKKNG